MLISDGFRRAVEAVLSRTTAWHDWTPTVDQGGAVATKAMTWGRYCLVGKAIWVRAYITISASGSAPNDIVISGLPSALRPQETDCTIGHGRILDSGSQHYWGFVFTHGGPPADFAIINFDQFARSIGTEPNFALANNDIIEFEAMYEMT